MTSTIHDAQRTVRALDVSADDMSAVANAIEDMYNDALDVIIVRGAFPRAPLAASGDVLDREDDTPGWARPNQKMPTEDIQLIGTPATPTYQSPRGPSLDGYLDTATKTKAAARAVFGDFDPAQQFRNVLARISGGRPVEVPLASDGRSYSPFTVRRLGDGKQIGLHHDYHYPLPLLADLAPQLDTQILVSFVVTVRKPDAGGELFVYPVTPDTPDPPKLPNGWAWDLAAVERRFTAAKFVTDVGDMFIFASGRCLHRVAPIVGQRGRITMGGFLALDKDRRRVLFWS